MQELLDLALKRIATLEKRLEQYYKMLDITNELDFIMNGNYIIRDELENILAGNYILGGK